MMLFFGQGADYTPVDLATGQPLPKERARAVTQEVWKDLRASVDRRVKASGCVFGGEEPK